MKIEMLLTSSFSSLFFFHPSSGKFALLNAKWGSFLVITEKCIITFDYAAIKDAEWQLLLLAERGNAAGRAGVTLCCAGRRREGATGAGVGARGRIQTGDKRA